MVLDRHGRIVRFNQTCQQMTGRRFAEVRGQPFWDCLLPLESVDEAKQAFTNLIEHGSPDQSENRWVGKDGRRILVAWTHAALRGRRGEVRLVVSAGVDVTEARRVEEKLRGHAARMAALAEAAQAFSSGLDYLSTLDAVVSCLTDALGDSCHIRVISEDGQWLEPVALRHRNPERTALMRPIVASSPQHVSEGLTAQVLRTGEALRIPELTQERIRTDMKPEYWHYLQSMGSLLIVPLKQTGRVFGHVTMLRERDQPPYSEEDEAFLLKMAVHAAQAIENARLYSIAQAAVAARDEFLSIASHELRTPLTALKLALENLSRIAGRSGPPQGPQGRDPIAAAKRQVARLEKLVSTLLDVSRIRSDRFELSLTEVDLGAVVNEVLANFADSLTEAGCEVRVTNDELARGNWDRFRMGQVVTNLLSNAIKYGEGKPIEITVSTEDRRVRLTVRDHGRGISARDQTRLFQRFARVQATQQYGGLGLGLYIVRRLVEAHGGSVSVESTLGQGTAFTVELPLQVEPRTQTE